MLIAAAAAAVCDTDVTGKFSVRTGSPCVAPTRGRRAAGQLNLESDVVVLLSWGTVTAQCPQTAAVAGYRCPGNQHRLVEKQGRTA